MRLKLPGGWAGLQNISGAQGRSYGELRRVTERPSTHGGTFFPKSAARPHSIRSRVLILLGLPMPTA
jgi:hypothetical protein